MRFMGGMSLEGFPVPFLLSLHQLRSKWTVLRLSSFCRDTVAEGLRWFVVAVYLARKQPM